MRELIKLRYKLLWAKTRNRNGRIALLLAGYLLLMLFIVLLAAGGFGAGMAAVKAGQAELVASVVLGSLFLNGVISAALLGFGVNSEFSDSALRRYPLTARQRLIGRHVIGLLDPLWFLILALDTGLAFGLYVFGTASLLLGLLAVLLLVAANYLAARAVSLALERAARLPGGPAVLLAGVSMLSFAAALPALGVGPQLKSMLAVLRLTPPFGAARLMLAGDLASFASGFGLLACALALLAAAVVALERLPTPAKTRSGPAATSIGPLDRFAALFGPSTGPLLARFLRYYIRNNRIRAMYPLAIPTVAFLLVMHAARRGSDILIFALGAFATVSFLATAPMAVNPFGYEASAFRRHFLLPVAPGTPLRAASYASVLLGSLLIPVALVLWAAFAPVPLTLVTAFMLFASGLTGLFFFNALAVWTALYGPRKVDYNSNFGNNLSLLGNVLLIGAMLLCLAGPQVLSHFVKRPVILGHWWVPGLAALLAVWFYRVSLSKGAALFVRRRELMLQVIEGRN